MAVSTIPAAGLVSPLTTATITTLTTTTISDGTNSTSATNCIRGSAKAWVQFQGSNGTINSSYNVSSVTRNSSGDFTVTFTNAFADANYAFAVSSQWNVSTNNSTIVWNAPTTTTLNIVTGTPTNAGRSDFTLISAICFR